MKALLLGIPALKVLSRHSLSVLLCALITIISISTACAECHPNSPGVNTGARSTGPSDAGRITDKIGNTSSYSTEGGSVGRSF